MTKLHAMSYASADTPPLFFIHGSADTRMAPGAQMDEYVKAVREMGAKDITYVRYDDGTGHGAYVQHLEESRRSREAFFIRTLMNKGKED